MSGKPRKYCPSCAGAVCACGARKSKESIGCKACCNAEAIAASVGHRKPFTCEGCGVAFGRRGKTKDAKRFCSRKCAYAHPEKMMGAARVRSAERRAARRAAVASAYATPISCARCGAKFSIRALGQRYCGDICMRAEASSRVKARANKGKTVRPKRPSTRSHNVHCQHCGTEFRTSANGKFCSVACRSRETRARRRAWKLGVRWEPIGLSTLSRRDGGLCHICNKPVLWTAKAPDPLSPSIDHVVPLSRGGSHTMGNTALAHFRCNYLKGAKTMEEMGLCA